MTDPTKSPGRFARTWAHPHGRLAIVALLALTIGGMIGGSGADEANSRAAAAEARIERAESNARDAERRAARAERGQVRAEREARGAKAAVRAELEQEYARKEASLDKREEALDARAAALTQQEEIAKRSTFGNGQWEVGVDIEPGKYRTDGGTPCYWAKLRPADHDIIDNNLAEGPQIVTLQAGIIFESKDCGTWTRQP